MSGLAEGSPGEEGTCVIQQTLVFSSFFKPFFFPKHSLVQMACDRRGAAVVGSALGSERPVPWKEAAEERQARCVHVLWLRDQWPHACWLTLDAPSRVVWRSRVSVGLLGPHSGCHRRAPPGGSGGRSFPVCPGPQACRILGSRPVLDPPSQQLAGRLFSHCICAPLQPGRVKLTWGHLILQDAPCLDVLTFILSVKCLCGSRTQLRGLVGCISLA